VSPGPPCDALDPIRIGPSNTPPPRPGRGILSIYDAQHEVSLLGLFPFFIVRDLPGRCSGLGERGDAIPPRHSRISTSRRMWR
jgi:hypothetical protein